MVKTDIPITGHLHITRSYYIASYKTAQIPKVFIATRTVQAVYIHIDLAAVLINKQN